MAENFTTNISQSFDIDRFAEEIVQQYQAKGFQVRTIKMKGMVKIIFDKKCGGINMLLGLGQGIAATCSMVGKEKDMLSVNFSDGDWIGKIIAGVLGFFTCMITWITGIIGICGQLSLPKDISNDMQIIISNME